MSLIVIGLAMIGCVAFLLYRNGSNKLEAPADGKVRTSDLRVVGETAMLALGLGLSLLFLLLLVRLTLGAILVVIGVAIIWVKIRQGQLVGQAVQVSEQQLPDIHAIAVEAAQRLNMEKPDVFVVQDPTINAYALGFLGRKSIVLNSATVEAMESAELASIIGHEFTHIKCAHTHWLVFTHLKDALRIPILSDLVGFLLLRWSRKAEYTCDRGGLVANGFDLYSSAAALIKVAVGKTLFEQMNLEAFFHQREQLDADGIARLSENLSTHPYIVNRLHAFQEFAESDYAQGFQESVYKPPIT